MSNGKVIFWAPMTGGNALDVTADPTAPTITNPEQITFGSNGALFATTGVPVDGNPEIQYTSAKLSNGSAEYLGKRFIIETTITPLGIKNLHGPNAPPNTWRHLAYQTAGFGTYFGFKLNPDLATFDLQAVWYDGNFNGADLGFVPLTVPLTLKLVYNNDNNTVTWYKNGTPLLTQASPRLGNPSLFHALNMAGNDKILGSLLVANTRVYTDLVDFTATPLGGSEPLAVQFTDMSLPTSDSSAWNWDFGDGHTSTQQNPVHTYAAGTYTVTLTANIAGSVLSLTKTAYITVIPQPVVIPPQPALGRAIVPPVPTLQVVRVVQTTPTYS